MIMSPTDLVVTDLLVCPLHAEREVDLEAEMGG